MKKSIAFILALVIAVSLIGCGNNSKSNNDLESNNQDSITNNTETGINSADGKALTANKIGQLESADDLTMCRGGIYYQRDGAYGIISPDGKNDTGAIYLYCNDNYKYFNVAKSDWKENDIASLNNIGLVNSKGEEIIPMKYATIEIMSNDYAKVCEVTERTYSKDDALVFITETGPFKVANLFPDDDDKLFTGNWYVYNLNTGKMVEGVSGSINEFCRVEGSYLKYYADGKFEFAVNTKGEKVTNEADFIGNGCYTISDETSKTVYDTNNNKLFTFEKTEYSEISASDINYFIAKVKAAENESNRNIYVVLNESGQVISSEFECKNQTEIVNSNLVLCDGKIYNYEGKLIVDGSFQSFENDEEFNRIIILNSSSDDDYKKTIIDNIGNILYKDTKQEGISISFSINAAYIKKSIDGDNTLFYNFKEKDFTINGYSSYKWLVETKKDDNGKRQLIDSYSGKAVLESYDDYNVGGSFYETLYAYAENGNVIDIYEITAV